MQALLRRLVLCCWILPLAAQTPATPKPFQETAHLGVPIVIGWDYGVQGTKELIEAATNRELTLASAELALAFPNQEENVVAAAGEKLLILRASVRNPEKKTIANLTTSNGFTLRLWQAYKGTGKFKFVAHFDPDTLHYVSKQLKSGESGQLISVWRVPADFVDFRLGLYYDKPFKIAWYDLGPKMGHIRSVFATPDGLGTADSTKIAAGQPFDLGALEMRVGEAAEPEMLAGSRRPASGHRYVVNLTVTNRLMLPARWGWQYLTVELMNIDGSVIKAYADIIDAATDKSWYGDLNGGATTIGRFVFTSDTPKMPQALRITMPTISRTVEAALAH